MEGDELVVRVANGGPLTRLHVTATRYQPAFPLAGLGALPPVEPLIGRPVEVPSALADLLARPAHAAAVPNDYAALRRAVVDSSTELLSVWVSVSSTDTVARLKAVPLVAPSWVKVWARIL